MSDDYVFLIDDNHEVLGTLSRALSRSGYKVGQADSGEEGLKQIRNHIPDLLVLDVMMPGMDGLEVCRILRSEDTFNRLPILFLSALSSTNDVVTGLDVGGDDYIVKPFEITELNARVRALLRRSFRDDDLEQISVKVGELTLDSTTHQLTIEDNASVQLTATEHRLMRYMMQHAQQALSPSHLLQAVWGYPPDAGDPDLVRAHVRNLRAKITQEGVSNKYVRTIHGVGYMVSENQQSNESDDD